MFRTILTASAALLLAATGMAQPRAGLDFAVSTSSGIKIIDRQTGAISTLVTRPTTGHWDWISMAQGNTDLVALNSSIIGRSGIARVTPAGAVVSMTTMPESGPVYGAALTQRGQYLITGSLNSLWQTSGNHNSIHTLHSNLPGGAANSICRDDDTGRYIIGTFSTKGLLLDYDAERSSWSTLASNLNGVRGVEHDQRTGHYVVATSTEVIVFDRNGKRVDSASFKQANGVRVDDLTGDVIVFGTNRIEVFDRNLKSIKTYGPLPGISSIHWLEIWGSRPLAPVVNASPYSATYYEVMGRFPDSANRGYVCGIGVSGLRPGVPFAGRMANIKPDALFFQSAAGVVPVFTVDFLGTTDSNGAFTAKFVMPPFNPISVHVTMVAAAINPRAPGGLDISPAITVYAED